MASGHPNLPPKLSSNGSAISEPSESMYRVSPQPNMSLSLVQHPEQINKLLVVDLKQHRGNADKLLEISVNLQILGVGLQAKIKELETRIATDLSKAPTRGSRRDTDESEFSQKKRSLGQQEGTAVVFSPSDNGLTVRQMHSMKDTDYIEAKLPGFHWWSDCLHIYFEKRSDSDPSSSTQLEVVVLKKKLSPSSPRDATFIRTVKLGQLGFRIWRKRLFGQIKVIYVLSPRIQQPYSTEMTAYNAALGPPEKTSFHALPITTKVEVSKGAIPTSSPLAR